MVIHVYQSGIIGEQDLEIKSKVTIIYGYNNSGKTTLLKAVNAELQKRLLKAFLSEKEIREIPLYIPTNRLVVSKTNTQAVKIGDYEDLMQYQKDALDNFALHLRNIRNELILSSAVQQFIKKAVGYIFGIEIKDIMHRYSDGVENVINIYLNIIWTIMQGNVPGRLTYKQLENLMNKGALCVLIDEIEMFLHVNTQTRLIECLTADFPQCSFVITTHSPLILARCREAAVYNIEAGVLSPILDELYYRDLDNIYDELFFVEELPLHLKEDIDYLGRIIMKEIEPDDKKIKDISEKMKAEYYNLFQKYNRILVKAQSMVEEYGKN